MTAPVAKVLRDAAELKLGQPELLVPQVLTRASAGIHESLPALLALRRHLGVDDVVTEWECPAGRPWPHNPEVLAALRACADEQDEDYTAAAVATGQSIGDEPWQHHDGEVIAMYDEQEASDG